MNRELREILSANTAVLRRGSCSFEVLYALTFSRPQRIMAEATEGFRIRRYTYGEIQKRCERIAAGIYARIGESHSYIGLEMENSVDWIAAFWGILKSGNKPYLVNTRHPKALSERILQTLGIRYIVAKASGALAAEYLPMDTLQGEGECPAAFENELAIASSGTSLKETICFYDGAAVAAQVANTDGVIRTDKRMMRMHKGSIKNLAFLPFYHIFGLFAVYFWFTCYHMTLVFLPDQSADTILKVCRRHEVTHIFAVPLLWHTVEKQILKQAEQEGKLEKLQKGLRLCTKLQNIAPYLGADLAQKLMGDVTDKLFGSSIKFCISGGSALRPAALELINGLGYPLHNGYGMSEIGIGSVELARRPKERNQNSIGKPFDSVEYRINEEGVLEVKGSSLCVKRLCDGQLLPTEGWFATGDLVEADESGRYFIRGRKGDIVIGESGENIDPDRIEELFSLQDARGLSVLGLQGERGEVLSAVVQINPYLSKERINALWKELQRINNTLPLPRQIRAFYLTTDPIMAETAIKVSRARLKQGIKDGSIRLQGFTDIKGKDAADFDRESPLAKKVLEIVGRILDKDPAALEPDAHLMLDLGASSLQYFSILSAMAEEFNLSAESGEEYRYTIRAFCEYIERHV